MAKWRDYVEPDLGPLDDDGEDIDPDSDVPLYLIPEPDPIRSLGFVPMFGAQPGWSPARENQAVGHCNICGFGHPDDPIRPGRKLVCMGCRRSGSDIQLTNLLVTTPRPEPDAKPETRPPRGKITVPRRFRPPTEATEP